MLGIIPGFNDDILRYVQALLVLLLFTLWA